MKGCHYFKPSPTLLSVGRILKNIRVDLQRNVWAWSDATIKGVAVEAVRLGESSN